MTIEHEPADALPDGFRLAMEATNRLFLTRMALRGVLRALGSRRHDSAGLEAACEYAETVLGFGPGQERERSW